MNFELKLFEFCLQYKWRKENKHNSTKPQNIFPINQVKVGKRTYGPINVVIFDDNNSSVKVTIGDYCSIGDKESFFLCENHQMDTLTTYSMQKKHLTK